MYSQIDGFVSRVCIPKDGNCIQCGRKFNAGEERLRVECDKSSWKSRSRKPGKKVSRSKRPDQSLSLNMPIQKLSTALNPCNCPAGKLENLELAKRIIYKWPVPEREVNDLWSVGVATAPRFNHDITTCLQSLRINGWYPQVFAEPGCEFNDVGECSIHINREKRGAWRNWVYMAETLLARNTPYILMMQDDTWVLPGTRHRLENTKWPDDAAFISLYLSKAQSNFNKPGLHPILQERKAGERWKPATIFWGACAWAFKREVLEAVLNHKMAKEWKGVSAHQDPGRRPDQVKHIDNVVPRLTKNQLGKRWYAFYPSASQHVASHSTIMHSPSGKPLGNHGNRAAETVMPDWSWGASTRSSGDSVYDEVLREWTKLFGRPDYPISAKLWNHLKEKLKTIENAQVLEFGSGVSSWLLRSAGATVTSIEQNPIIAAASGAIYRPVINGWYDWEPDGTKYDLILIDGPAHRGRGGIIYHISKIVKPGTIVVVDDTNRMEERVLAQKLKERLKAVREVKETDNGRQWTVLTTGGGR